jgi:hypothetical protein
MPGDVAAQVIAHPAGIPAGPRQQVPHFILRGVPALPGDGPGVLARQFGQHPTTNPRTRRRGSTLPNCEPISPISSSEHPSHRPGSTLWPAATVRSLSVLTNRPDHPVTVLLPAVSCSR